MLHRDRIEDCPALMILAIFACCQTKFGSGQRVGDLVGIEMSTVPSLVSSSCTR